MRTPEDKVGQLWCHLFAEYWQDAYLVRRPDRILKFQNAEPIRRLRQRCHLTGREVVLEAGCGGALWGLSLAAMGCEVTALDISERMLANVEKALQSYAETYGVNLNASAVHGDLTHLPFRNQFDLVINDGVVEHWLERSERGKIIEQMVKATKQGGYVALTIPNNYHPLYWLWYINPNGFKRGPLAEARIRIEDFQEELREAGLIDVVIEGYQVFQSLSFYPAWLPLKCLARGLETVIPDPPQWIRRKWGTWFLACGQKPHLSEEPDPHLGREQV